MLEDIEIISKLKEEKNLNEISKELDISLFDVHKRIMKLKNEGYVLIRMIHDDGNINYFVKYYPEFVKTNSVTLKLCNRSKFSAMLISDTHFGNEFEHLDYLDKVYEYCKECDIHIIINGGDLVDGGFSQGNQSISDPIKQVDYVLENHPFDESIINLICLGNHDFSLYKSGIDIKTVLENSRNDLIPMGYGLGIINVENDQIFVKHCIPEYTFESIEKKFILEGHKHKMAVSEENGLLVNIPTLSNLVLGKHEFPGAIRMDLTFDNEGIINVGRFEQFIFTEKMHTISELIINFDIDHTHLYEKDIRPKIKSKQGYNGLSQTEKFNQRWNRN